MGRGRRARATPMHSQPVNTVLNTDDQCCASPKRKEYKIEPSKNFILKTVLARESLDAKKGHMNLRGGRITKDIASFFPNQMNENSVIDLTDDTTCDESTNGNFSNTNLKPSNMLTNFIGAINNSDRIDKPNIFLEEPVLSLKIEKTSTVASSLIIRKNFGLTQNFGSPSTLLLYEENQKFCSPLDLSKPTQVTEIDSTTFLNSDSNSCDSGVVIDKGNELSPERNAYRKPITPHRILCPSPIKQCQQPISHLIQRKFEICEQKKNFKSKKRLNVNGENVSKLINNKNEDNSVKPIIKENKTLTEYFQLRRSVRKTKKEVQEEKLKNIEVAVIEGKEDDLEVRVFGDKGRGIIAKRFFSKGEFVVEYIGELISSAEAQTREEEYAQDQNTGCYMYYFKHKNQQYCIDATAESGRLGRLVNHSRNGNLIPRTMMIKNKPRLVLFAKEDIPCGDEVTYDYGDRSKESLIHHPWLAL